MVELVKWPFILLTIFGSFWLLYSWGSYSKGRSLSDFFTFTWLLDSENVSGGGNAGKITCFIIMTLLSLFIIYLELPKYLQLAIQDVLKQYYS